METGYLFRGFLFKGATDPSKVFGVGLLLVGEIRKTDKKLQNKWEEIPGAK